MRRTVHGLLAASVAIMSSLPVEAAGPGLILETSVTLPAANQGGLFTFNASAGQYLSITMQNQGSNVSSVQLRVQDPSLAVIYNQTVTAPPNGGLGAMACNAPGAAGGCWGNTVINLGPLTLDTAGEYTVTATSRGGSGSLAFTVSSALNTNGLSVDQGPVSRSAINPGQSLIMPVQLQAGVGYTLKISEVNGYAPGNQGVVIGPTGTVVANIAMAASCANPCGLGQYTGGGYTVFTPVANGDHRILLQQQTQTSGPNVYGPLWNTMTFEITHP